MRSDLDRIRAAFTGTPMAGLPIGYGPEGIVLVDGIDPGRLYEAWQAADALVPVLGWRPVLVTDDFAGLGELESRRPEPGPSEPELRAFAAAAEVSDPWRLFGCYGEERELHEGELELYVPADLLALVSDVPLPVTYQQLQRVLYDRLLADEGRHAQMLDRVRYVTQTGYWFTPESVLLMLVPTTDVRRSAYWLRFYGAPTQEYKEKLAEVLARWEQRWDARLVACWGTMLQFQVGRRPTPGDDAWDASGQLMALAPNLSLLRWEVAVAMPAGSAWFVHNRP